MDNEGHRRETNVDGQPATRCKVFELGLVEMRDGILYLTIAGQNIVWNKRVVFSPALERYCAGRCRTGRLLRQSRQS
jgi:hypothetical protein